MEDKSIVICGIDVGLTGGISIFDGKKFPKIYSMPVISIVKSNKKKKNIYNICEIVKIFKPYINKKVIFAIERQSSRPGEGSVSSFTNGTGYGILQGIGHGLFFQVVIIDSKKWKKYFPEIMTSTAEIMKNEQKEKRNTLKNIKDIDLKKQYKSNIDKLNRLIKADAKKQARLIVQKLYPKMKQEFVKTKDDGKADAILIGLAIKKIYKEKNYDLVQNS